MSLNPGACCTSVTRLLNSDARCAKSLARNPDARDTKHVVRLLEVRGLIPLYSLTRCQPN